MTSQIATVSLSPNNRPRRKNFHSLLTDMPPYTAASIGAIFMLYLAHIPGHHIGCGD